MKINIRHVSILLAILLLSVAFGFAFDAVMTAIERNEHPIVDAYAEQIRATAEEFALPEAILWAVVRTESNFASNAVGEDGSIGLMQLTPQEFTMIQTDILKEAPEDAGRLYDPEKNLQCGAAYLSYLYERYGVWETVFAAFDAGIASVDAWLANPEYVTELGTLKKIPDAKTARFVRDVEKAHQLYTKLYF